MAIAHYSKSQMTDTESLNELAENVHDWPWIPDEVPQTDEQLWWWVSGWLGVQIPAVKVCEEHTPPFKAFADAFFARSPVSIWKASRGYGGKSFMLATLATTEAILLGAQSSILGGSGAQSLNVHSHCRALWDAATAPKFLLVDEPTKYDTYLTNGGHLRSLLASQTSVRGPHPQRLRMDEIDEMDISILEAAQGQPMRKTNRYGQPIETQTVFSSTHQYPDGTMKAMLDRAKEKGWPVYSWCYKECANPYDGWLQPAEVIRKRQEIPESMFAAEYDLQEPNFEDRAIDSELVLAAFSDGERTYAGDKPVRDQEHELGMKYVTGVDWAKERDLTVVATFRIMEGNRYKCVAWDSFNKLPWRKTIERAMKQWTTYGGIFVHDRTGIGNVIEDHIRDLVPMHHQRRIKGVTMTRGNKHSMFTEYIAGIENQEVTYPMIQNCYDEHRYATIDDLFGTGHPPDSIVAGALAWMYRPKTSGMVAPKGMQRESTWLH